MLDICRFFQPGGHGKRTIFPHDWLLEVLNELAAAGIVESKRGPDAGYRLNRWSWPFGRLFRLSSKFSLLLNAQSGFSATSRVVGFIEFWTKRGVWLKMQFKKLQFQIYGNTGVPVSRKVIPLRLSQHRIGSANMVFVLAILVLGTVISAAIWFIVAGSNGTPAKFPDAAKSTTREIGSQASASSLKFPVIINKPDGPPRVDTGLADIHGNAITVACSTCHSTRQPDFENRTPADLNEFHGSLAFAHGMVSCLSCHNSNDYDALKLADQTRVEFVDVTTLCAQCHGPQMTAFEHGTHGGMNGYWDRSLGPQSKNSCIDCHHPHSPKFPHMQPNFKPKDRFLKKTEH